MSERPHEADLTLKERVNFPYLLANQILTIQKAFLVADSSEKSEREKRDAILGFVYLMPKAWKDGKFKKEMEDAKIKLKRDKRPRVAIHVRMSEKICKQLGIPAFVEEITFDYYKVFQACMNLLNRKKMLSKIVLIEELESIDFESIEEDAVLESDFSSK